MQVQSQPFPAANIASVSLFSPWQALYSSVNPFFTPQAGSQGNSATFPFPSPSLGITIGDTFVPWPDLSAFNGAHAGPGGMSTGITPSTNGFPFPQQPTQLKQDRKDSLVAAERQAPSRFDSTSSGGSTSTVSASLQTPEACSTPLAQNNSGSAQQLPSQQGFPQFQTPMLNFGQASYGFPSNGQYAAQVNTFPPSANNATQPTSAGPGWHPYNVYSNQFYAPPPLQMGPNAQVGPTSIEAPLVSRTSSTSTHHSSISPAMLSNQMASRMPSQPSAFGHLPDEEDGLAVISSAAPSEYGGPGMSSRGPSPEIMKKDRKRRSSGPHSARRPGGEVDAVSDAGSGEDEDAENEAEPEGVERNGMMWGMKTEAYKALSARERKRVRNRISARTFRARRKGQSHPPSCITPRYRLKARFALRALEHPRGRSRRQEHAHQGFAGRNSTSPGRKRRA